MIGVAIGMFAAASLGIYLAWNSRRSERPDGYAAEEVRLWTTL